MKKPIAFISHSSSDRQRATELAVALRERQIQVWIDHEQIRFGDSIPRKISEGLDSADVILVLVSEQFTASRWCRVEYEPLIVREIDTGKTCVIPVLLDDAQMPVLFRAKRHLDLRSGISGRKLDELASQIGAEKIVTAVTHLPRAASYHASLLSMVLGGFVEDFPVSTMTDEQLVSGRSLLDLYRAVEKMIGLYQDLAAEILSVWNDAGMKSSIFGSAWRIPAIRVQSANRKLSDLANDMKTLATSLEGIINADSALISRLGPVLELCVTISVGEDFLLLELGRLKRFVDVADLRNLGWGGPTGEIEDCVVDDNAQEMYYGGLGREVIEDLEHLLLSLSSYRVDLRAAVAKAVSQN